MTWLAFVAAVVFIFGGIGLIVFIFGGIGLIVGLWRGSITFKIGGK